MPISDQNISTLSNKDSNLRLICKEWCRIFTPFLFETIQLDTRNSLSQTDSRILSSYGAFVRTLDIIIAQKPDFDTLDKCVHKELNKEQPLLIQDMCGAIHQTTDTFSSYFSGVLSLVSILPRLKRIKIKSCTVGDLSTIKPLLVTVDSLRLASAWDFEKKLGIFKDYGCQKLKSIHLEASFDLKQCTEILDSFPSLQSLVYHKSGKDFHYIHIDVNNRRVKTASIISDAFSFIEMSLGSIFYSNRFEAVTGAIKEKSAEYLANQARIVLDLIGSKNIMNEIQEIELRLDSLTLDPYLHTTIHVEDLFGVFLSTRCKKIESSMDFYPLPQIVLSDCISLKITDINLRNRSSIDAYSYCFPNLVSLRLVALLNKDPESVTIGFPFLKTFTIKSRCPLDFWVRFIPKCPKLQSVKSNFYKSDAIILANMFPAISIYIF